MVMANEPRRILVVHSFGRDFLPFADVATVFRSEVARLSPVPVEFMDASLEMARFDGGDRDGPLLDFLLATYRDHPPDLLVPIGAQAAQFCVRTRDTLFADTPILMLAVERRRLAGLIETPGVASVGVDLEVGRYVENILDVLPGTKHVYVVMGTAPLGRFWEGVCRTEWARYESQVTFHWLSDEPIDAICRKVINLPPDSAVFVGIVNRDAAGVPHEAGAALHAIAKVSAAPIFGYTLAQLGDGIVGGRLAPMPAVGEAGADAAVRILAGEPVSSIGTEELPLADPAYDWRELDRWGIRESRLPPGSTVLFRQPGLWETHRTALLAALAFILIQSVLIARLLAARRRARQTDASLSLAADAAKIGLWQSGTGARGFTASSRWRTIFGFSPSQLLSIREVLECIHPDDRDALTGAIERAASDGRSFSLEHRIVRPDGSVRWIATHGRADSGGNGHRNGTRGASIDITGRREAEATADLQRQELAHLSRVSSLGVLSGALAHELNQPLGIILSNAQAARHLLDSANPDIGELRDILDDIVNEDRRAGQVIERLRALLRRGESTRQPVDVNESVREVIRLTESDRVRRKVTLEARLGEGLPPVLSDRVQLQQVVLNLLVNACDAMEERPPGERSVTVETGADGGWVRIAVRDRGSGLPDDTEELFKPFHTTKERGLGMGLTICRMLIVAHHGTLSAESVPDGGAVFTIALPLALGKEAA